MKKRENHEYGNNHKNLTKRDNTPKYEHPANHINTNLTVEEVAEHFWLPQDDTLLLEELIVEGKVAAVQLLVKYMPELLEIAKEIYPLSKDKEKIMAEVMRCFLENLSYSYVDYYHQKSDESYSMGNYLNTVKQEMIGQLRGDNEKMKPHRFNESQIAKLNKLNQVLREKQVELWGFVEEQITYLDKMLNQENTNFSNCELKLGIQFYMMKNSQPLHTMNLTINLNNRKEMAEQMTNLGFDWRTNEMTMLDEPTCYLLGQLYEQWQIAHHIPDIVMIWTTIQVDYQSSTLLKDNEWKLITRNDSILQKTQKKGNHFIVPKTIFSWSITIPEGDRISE